MSPSSHKAPSHMVEEELGGDSVQGDTFEEERILNAPVLVHVGNAGADEVAGSDINSLRNFIEKSHSIPPPKRLPKAPDTIDRPRLARGRSYMLEAQSQPQSHFRRSTFSFPSVTAFQNPNKKGTDVNEIDMIEGSSEDEDSSDSDDDDKTEKAPETAEVPTIKEDAPLEEVKPVAAPEPAKGGIMPILRRAASVSAPGMRRAGSVSGALTGKSISELKGSRSHVIADDLDPSAFSVKSLSDLSQIGKGAMCDVFMTKYKSEIIAVKTPKKNGPPTASNDLEVEVVLLKQLVHPHIIKIVCVGHESPGGATFVGLEFMTNRVLTSLISERGSDLPMKEILRIILEIADGLKFLHFDAIPGHIILHRDLKPDNVGLTAGNTVKLLDLGLAKVVRQKYRDASATYAMTANTGSPRFMAPEVACGKPYNEKVDVYSWALVAWYVSTRQWPYKYPNLNALGKAVWINGERPALKEAWSLSFKDMLKDGWNQDYLLRPGFNDLVPALTAMHTKALADGGGGGCNCNIS